MSKPTAKRASARLLSCVLAIQCALTLALAPLAAEAQAYLPSTIGTDAAIIFRDCVTTGLFNPCAGSALLNGSPNWDVQKPQVRALFGAIQTAVGGVSVAANNTALLALPTAAVSYAQRQGYAAPGDGGAANYYGSLSPCNILVPTIATKGNYAYPPLLTFSGGSGTGAAGYADINNAGQLAEIVITNEGTGYTAASPPTVGFLGGGGSGGGAVTIAVGGDGGSEVTSINGGCWLVDTGATTLTPLMFGVSQAASDNWQGFVSWWYAAKRLGVDWWMSPGTFAVNEELFFDWTNSGTANIHTDGTYIVSSGNTTDPAIQFSCGQWFPTIDSTNCAGPTVTGAWQVRASPGPPDFLVLVGWSNLSDVTQGLPNGVGDLICANGNNTPQGGCIQFTFPTSNAYGKTVGDVQGGGGINSHGVAAGIDIVATSTGSDYRNVSGGAGECAYAIGACANLTMTLGASAIQISDPIGYGVTGFTGNNTSNSFGKVEDLEASTNCFGITSSVFDNSIISPLYAACFVAIAVSPPNLLTLGGTFASGHTLTYTDTTLSLSAATTTTASDTLQTASAKLALAINASTALRNLGAYAVVNNTFVQFTGSISGNVLTVPDGLVSNGAFRVGQHIADSTGNLTTPGITIVAQLTGVGNCSISAPGCVPWRSGTYQLSASATVASELMIASAVANIFLEVSQATHLTHTGTFASTGSETGAFSVNNTIFSNRLDALTFFGSAGWVLSPPGGLTGFTIGAQGSQSFYEAPYTQTYFTDSRDDGATISSYNASASQIVTTVGTAGNLGDMKICPVSTTGIVAGMYVQSYTVPSGSTVTSISGGCANFTNSTSSGTTRPAPVGSPITFVPAVLGGAETLVTNLHICQTLNGGNVSSTRFIAENGNPHTIQTQGSDTIYSGAAGGGVSSLTLTGNGQYVDLECLGTYWLVVGQSSSSSVNLTLSGYLHVQGTTPSTSQTTGAIVDAGGLGVAGTIYSGPIVASGNIQATSAATGTSTPSSTPTTFSARAGTITTTAGTDINFGGFGAESGGNNAMLNVHMNKVTSTGAWTGTAVGISYDVDSAVGAGGALWFYNGNVGIGTSSPATALSVVGTGYFTGNLTAGNGIAALGTSGSNVGILQFFNATSGGGYLLLEPPTGALGTGVATLPNNTGTLAETNLAQTFSATQTFSNATYSALFTGGNVGVGTTSPTAALFVVAATNSQIASFSGNTGTNYPSYNASYLSLAGNFSGGNAESDIWNTINPTASPNTGIRFLQQTGASSYTDLMFLKNNGNVGIGTTSPSALLEVTGTAKVDGTLTGADGGAWGSGGLNGSAIGATTPEPGTFTNVSTTGSVKLSGAQIGYFAFTATAVNFNAANSDTAIAISLPPPYTRFQLNAIRIDGASASISTATAGVYTATAAGGTQIAAMQALTVSASADNTANNAMLMTVVTGFLTTTALTTAGFPTLYLHVGTAEGSAATANVMIQVAALP